MLVPINGSNPASCMPRPTAIRPSSRVETEAGSPVVPLPSVVDNIPKRKSTTHSPAVPQVAVPGHSVDMKAKSFCAALSGRNAETEIEEDANESVLSTSAKPLSVRWLSWLQRRASRKTASACGGPSQHVVRPRRPMQPITESPLAGSNDHPPTCAMGQQTPVEPLGQQRSKPEPLSRIAPLPIPATLQNSIQKNVPLQQQRQTTKDTAALSRAVANDSLHWTTSPKQDQVASVVKSLDFQSENLALKLEIKKLRSENLKLRKENESLRRTDQS